MSFLPETVRLSLRELTAEDAAFILQLLNTEGWLKYIGDRKVHTMKQAVRYITEGPVASYQAHGFGLWAVISKAEQKPVGICGLIKRDNLAHPDLGFAFLPEHMGKGFALESAEMVIRHAFEQIKLQQVLAITLPENEACIKLLQRVGFLSDGSEQWPPTGEILLRFRISAQR